MSAVTIVPTPEPGVTRAQVEVLPPEACRNCGAPLPHPRPNYCGHCGQETHLKPPTVGEFLQQFGGSYIAMEGALWRTLLLLLFRPGRLTKEYFAGRKRRYVLPLRLYLTISVVALLALQWSGAVRPPPDRPLIQLDGGAKDDFTVMDMGSIVARVQDGKFVCKGLPESWCERGRERFSLDAKGLEREMRQVPERFVRHWGSAMFALLPIYALLLKLVYRSRRMRWSEHLVFALHLHAFIFAMVIVQLADIGWVHDLAILAMPVYSVMALQKVYGGRWWATTLRVMTLGFLYFVAMVMAMAVVAIWAFMT
ncbi:DUF3667 domain-containing protein [Ideonella sp. YS5]|uniref:DUF3667 domain-containing protein n=1 Tax=Ideonella sp. YS5 TaxID=3453714 RepID=UPI003EE9049D